jgi:hypothetical protein
VSCVFHTGYTTVSNAYLDMDFLQYLFDSVMDISVLPCGHTMHQICLEEMNLHSQYALNLNHRMLITHVIFQLEVSVDGLLEGLSVSRFEWVLCPAFSRSLFVMGKISMGVHLFFKILAITRMDNPSS